MYNQKINQIKYLTKYRGMAEIEIMLSKFVDIDIIDYTENELDIIIKFLSQDDYKIIFDISKYKKLKDLVREKKSV